MVFDKINKYMYKLFIVDFYSFKSINEKKIFFYKHILYYIFVLN